MAGQMDIFKIEAHYADCYYLDYYAGPPLPGSISPLIWLWAGGTQGICIPS
ncbi:MAG: hypothetical protein H0X26_05105 [Alphaproteobacteria bacterium]|nr:hypothetical protein [Alphaproteobacteria bacterium]